MRASILNKFGTAQRRIQLRVVQFEKFELCPPKLQNLKLPCGLWLAVYSSILSSRFERTMASKELPATLSDLTTWATSADDQALIQLLLDEDQAHLFRGFRPGEDISKKKEFLAQVRALQNGGYPGGLKAYLSNARGLLRSSAGGDNPFVGMTPEVPSGEASTESIR
jgi:hypothetical protein